MTNKKEKSIFEKISDTLVLVAAVLLAFAAFMPFLTSIIGLSAQTGHVAYEESWYSFILIAEIVSGSLALVCFVVGLIFSRIDFSLYVKSLKNSP